MIIDACIEITEEMYHRVINNLGVRVEEVLRRYGVHIKYVIQQTLSRGLQATLCI